MDMKGDEMTCDDGCETVPAQCSRCGGRYALCLTHVQRRDPCTCETQRGIAEWRVATFGRSADPARLVARAGEEFLELMKLLLPASDLSDRVMDSVRDYWAATATTPTSSLGQTVDLADIKDEMADVLVVLFGAAEEYGFDLLAEVARKMAVNRARRWETHGDGTGQHRREEV